jgi:hypothetical protein
MYAYTHTVAILAVCSIEDPFDRYDWDFFFKFRKTIDDGEQEEGEQEQAEGTSYGAGEKAV